MLERSFVSAVSLKHFAFAQAFLSMICPGVLPMDFNWQQQKLLAGCVINGAVSAAMILIEVTFSVQPCGYLTTPLRCLELFGN